jgi:hypothetical protein
MDGPYGHLAWWMKMKSGKHHLTTLRREDSGRNGKIYPACAPDIGWGSSSRLGLEIVLENPSRIPENVCEVCQRYAVLWGMLS